MLPLGAAVEIVVNGAARKETGELAFCRAGSAVETVLDGGCPKFPKRNNLALIRIDLPERCTRRGFAPKIAGLE